MKILWWGNAPGPASVCVETAPGQRVWVRAVQEKQHFYGTIGGVRYRLTSGDTLLDVPVNARDDPLIPY